MKIFLSSLEEAHTPSNEFEIPTLSSCIISKGIKMKWNLCSYFYLRNRTEIGIQIRDNSELMLIDSGAHSFQFGKKVNFDEYTKQYADFIKSFDRPNVIGYFEMDIENVVGMGKVLEFRKILEGVSDKIIPVWHKNRGIEDFESMCERYANKIIAIGGFRGTDIRDDQYLLFLKYAKKFNCKVHCLGMTRTEILDKCPFDYVDSASWQMNAIYGRVLGQKNLKLRKAQNGREHYLQKYFNYLQGMEMQKYYYNKWRKVCKD